MGQRKWKQLLPCAWLIWEKIQSLMRNWIQHKRNVWCLSLIRTVEPAFWHTHTKKTRYWLWPHFPTSLCSWDYWTRVFPIGQNLASPFALHIMCLSGFYFCSLMKDDSRVLNCCFHLVQSPPSPCPPPPTLLSSHFHCLFCALKFLLLLHGVEEGFVLFCFPGAGIHNLMDPSFLQRIMVFLNWQQFPFH